MAQWEELKKDSVRYQQYLDKRKEGGWWKRLMWKHNLTKDRYLQMERAQSGVCAICKKPQQVQGTITRLVVDHDHATGEVRELLCSRCNTGVGMFCDDVVVMQEAIAYVQRHRS